MSREELEYINLLQEKIDICKENISALKRYSLVIAGNTNGCNVDWYDVLRDSDEDIRNVLKKYYESKILAYEEEIRKYIKDY